MDDKTDSRDIIIPLESLRALAQGLAEEYAGTELPSLSDETDRMVTHELSVLLWDPNISQWGDPYDDFCLEYYIPDEYQAVLEKTARGLLTPVLHFWGEPRGDREYRWAIYEDHVIVENIPKKREQLIIPEIFLDALYSSNSAYC